MPKTLKGEERRGCLLNASWTKLRKTMRNASTAHTYQMPKAQKQILWELEHKCRTTVKATTYYTIIEHAIYTITSQTRNLERNKRTKKARGIC
jgi:hypothetical protein